MAAEIRAGPVTGPAMGRRDALLLVDRLKRRTRDPDVLTLCEYVRVTDVHGTIPAFRRPDVPWTQPAVMPFQTQNALSSRLCPGKNPSESAYQSAAILRHGRD